MSSGSIVLKSELANALALKYGMEVNSLMEVLSNTIIPNKKATKEHVVTLLVVAQQYDLNPFVREIQAFPNSSGGITPMVGIEGWTAIVNRHPAFDGCTLDEIFDEKGKLVCVECTMYRKDRSHPIKVREYYDECKRNTQPWGQWPIRMLRHKAYIQCARVAFSLSGIYDIDEIERMESLGVVQRPDVVDGVRQVDLNALPEQTVETQPTIVYAKPEKKAKRRGRPAGSTNKPKEEPKPENPDADPPPEHAAPEDPETAAARERVAQAKKDFNLE